ncbi:MAG: phosphatidylserine decarboxylase, partial [Christensenellaceae bacterium]
MDCIDRNGNITHISTNQDRFLQRLYGSLFGRCLVFLLIRPSISKLAGIFMNCRFSTHMIQSFIKKHSIPMSDYEPCDYSSYNDFFTRKIKAEKRPIPQAPNVLISPSDGKVSVYPIQKHSVFQIKGASYTVESLLKNRTLAEAFAEGYCVIIRLTVDDYHRYCYVADGVKGDNIAISGVFHTVNPIALQYVPVYKENSREYTVLQSTNFGEIIQMEVGAMMVGKISNYH